MDHRFCLLALALTTSLAPAQSPKPATVIPGKPLVTIHIDGPAAMRAAFLPTNLGKMFSGPEFKDMVAPMMQMFEGLKKEGGELPFDVEELEKAMLNYNGRVTMGLHLLADEIDFDDRTPPKFMVTVAMTPDGKTDLAAFCAKCKTVGTEKMGEQLKDIEAGGKTLSVMQAGDDPTFCLPFMHKDHAVILLSNDMAAAGAKVLGAESFYTSEGTLAKSSIGINIDAKRIADLFLDAGKRQAGPQWDAMGVHIVKALGVRSLQKINMVFRAFGPAVLSEMNVDFNDNDRGIIGTFMPKQASRSTLQDLLPRTAMTANAMPCDLGHLFTTVKQAFADMGENAPMSWDEMVGGFKEQFGLRIKEDLVDHFAKSMLTLQMESAADAAGSSMLGSAEGTCIGFKLTNGKALMKSIETILAKTGMDAARKKTDYKGFKMFNLNIAMAIDLNYAITDDLLAIGIGTSSDDPVRALLDECKNRQDGTELAALPGTIDSRLKMVKNDWVSMGWTDMASTIDSAVAQLDNIASDLPPEMAMITEMLDKMPKLMKKYKVKYQVAVSRFLGSRFHYQAIY